MLTFHFEMYALSSLRPEKSLFSCWLSGRTSSKGSPLLPAAELIAASASHWFQKMKQNAWEGAAGPSELPDRGLLPWELISPFLLRQV